MQVICTDGTVLQCDRFEAIDSGVLLFDEGPRAEAGEEETEDEEADQEATAFVPLHQLRFVLPDGIRPDRPNQQPVGQTPPQSQSQTPPTGGTPPQGQAPPQQPRGGQQPSRQPGPGRSQSRPGRR